MPTQRCQQTEHNFEPNYSKKKKKTKSTGYISLNWANPFVFQAPIKQKSFHLFPPIILSKQTEKPNPVTPIC